MSRQHSTTAGLPAATREALLLSYVTVGYNLIEGVVSVVFAYAAGSAALLGFGMDSFVESFSGLVMIWRFTGSGEHRERQAVRLVGGALLILAGYVIYESATKLVQADEPDPSLVGIAIAVVSLVVMPILFFRKQYLAKTIGSRSLSADAKQTLACVLLSVALLVGLGLNYWFDWWRADPIAGLVIAVFLAREGYEVLRNQELCC